VLFVAGPMKKGRSDRGRIALQHGDS